MQVFLLMIFGFNRLRQRADLTASGGWNGRFPRNESTSDVTIRIATPSATKDPYADILCHHNKYLLSILWEYNNCGSTIYMEWQ